MSDMYTNNNNNNRNDIDDFFAEFDRQAAKQNTPSARRADSQRRPDSAGRSSAGERRRETSGDMRRHSNRTRRPEQQAGRRSASGRKDSARSTSGRRGSGRNKGGKANFGSGKSSILNIALFCILGFVMAIGIYVGIVFATAPKVDTDDIYSMLAQRSTIYDSDGKEIDNLYMSDGNRTIIEYDDIPEDMVNAIVALEDKKFWKHNGFNFIRMIGAVKDSIFGGGNISGTSTVTQQLARNVYLAEIKSQRSLSRKLSEMYCTIVLEKNLTKEQIMEAYLNTIYLGFNSYGIEAASQSYFSKPSGEMDVLECASLAALPQSPDTYALVQYSLGGSELPVIASDDSMDYVYNGDITTERRNLVLKNMAKEGFITEDELNEALNDNLQSHIKLTTALASSATSYFTDFAVDQLIDDIVEEYGYSEADAQNMVYTGGLKIYTTMDSNIQSIIEDEFNESNNFVGISSARTNSSGDLLSSETGKVLLYSYSKYFNDNNEFVLSSDEYTNNSDGGITILAGKRLNIYETEVNGEPDVSIEFKGMYTKDDGIFYFIESGALSIPQGYKTVDGQGNAVISGQFFKDYPEFFNSTDDGLMVTSSNYTLKHKVRQPQGAMVIIENETGYIKGMIGGRETQGKQLFNRATNPRQPGSSIKPIGAYGPALQMSYEYHKDGKTMKLDTSEGSDWGKYITAGSIINDAAMTYGGRTWPKNWYSGYKGDMTLRTAVQQSVNVCAVKVYQQIGPDYAASMLKKNGISTIDDEGEVNDLNPAALALGGMTSGISPLEMAAAYATFPNGGVYNKPSAYTKVLDSNDDILIEKKSEGVRVYDEGVAWIMTDILRTVVTNGIAGGASIGSQPVGGKTGTTDDNFDIWFCGFTPQYSAAIWMGTDVNIELSGGSGRTASFWSEIMGRVCEGLPRASFKSRPSNVEVVGGEYYIKGTYSKVTITPSSTDAPSSEETTAPTTTTQPSQNTSTEDTHTQASSSN